MHLLYNIGIILYGSILRIAALFHPKAKLWAHGRRDFFSTLPNFEKKEIYWFHCASLGEFDQALPVINLLKKNNPSLFILVTFFSPSGFLHYHKRNHNADYVCYLPLDTPSNARKFITHFSPSKVFFVKYEFWANYIFEVKKSGAKLYSISAIFRAEHRFFKKYATFFRSLLHQFDFFFIQNNASAELLKSIGIANFQITGDTRFDRVIENKNNLQKNILVEHYLGAEKAFIIGSSWPIDEDLFIPLINQGILSQKVILAPHDISKDHMEQIIGKLKIPFLRYSEVENGGEMTDQKILLLDTIGALANAYSYGAIAYIGGGFSGSLHNILEPAVFGLPVIFGPKHSKFPEAQMFIDEGIGFSIETTEEILDTIEKIKSQQEILTMKTANFVNRQAGASLKIVQFLEKN
jgi:3-deoxy-D-manno-octulosonic-acid transferase